MRPDHGHLLADDIGVQNIGTGVVTISPNGLNLDGASSSLTLAQTQGLAISTDATNYFTERGAANAAASFGGVSVKTADYTAVTGDCGIENGSCALPGSIRYLLRSTLYDRTSAPGVLMPFVL